MRIPLAANLESRDGSTTKDAKVVNGLIESRGEGMPPALKKRQGTSDAGLINAGLAQLLTYWNGDIVAIQGDKLNAKISRNTYATWNPSDKSANVTLSNGNLTEGASIVWYSVRSTVGVSSGKWYWEISGNDATNPQWFAGVGNASASLSTYPGGDANGWGFQATGNKYHSAVSASYGGTQLGINEVIGVALDMDAGTVTIYRSNASEGVMYSGLTGTVYAMAASNSGDTVTVNFGATAFTYSVPAGYNAGLYTSSSSGVSSVVLNPTNPLIPFSGQDNGSNAPTSQLMFKNASQAWTLDVNGNLNQITNLNYPGKYTVTLTSLTRSGTVATATIPNNVNFQVGSTVTIAGATPSGYNGSQIVTGVTPGSSTTLGPIAITITRSNTTATAVTVSEPHGFTNGQTVHITGADQSAYNGDFVITYVDARTFTFTVAVVTNGLTSPATGTIVYAARLYGVAANYTGTWLSPSPYNGSYNNFHFTATQGAHGLQVGDQVTFPFPNMGTVTLTAVTATTFDFTVSGFTAQSQDSNGVSLTTPATVSSLTFANGLATLTTSTAHKVSSAWHVYVAGATPGNYDVSDISPTVSSSTVFTYPIAGAVSNDPASPATGTITAEVNTVVAPSFTFTVSSGLTTPATGTITASGGRNTVPGIAYLDGYFCVMDVNGVVYNSASDDPSTWNALEYMTAQAETGAGKAITRTLNYILALKEWSAEFFWDAQNPPPGSPLGPVDNGLILVGCASGTSVAKVDGNIFWLSQVREQGRSVHMALGIQAQKVSTPDVERILNGDDLATVYAYGLKVDGHPLYVLTLVTSKITLVYDLQSQQWSTWSSLTAGNAVSVSSITLSGTTATVTTSTAHGMSDGDPVTIAGANQSAYNGTFQIQYVSGTVFTIQVSGSPASPATGTITATPYTESYFNLTKYADCNGLNMFLHETNGHLYQMQSSLYQDSGVPINLFVRTIRLDGGTLDKKKWPVVRLVTDTISDTAMLRASNDDSQTFCPYRILDLSLEKPELRRWSAARRKSFEFRYTGNNTFRTQALELETAQ